MSKVLRISQGGYKIITEPGSEILLDTGLAAGQGRITGDLIVEGDRTELNVQVLEVEDRIVVINNVPGSTSDGIELYNGDRTAGIEIRRGALNAVRLVFDDNQNYYPPNSVDLNQGIFIFKGTGLDSNVKGIRTNYIESGDGSIHFNVGNDIGNDPSKLQVKIKGSTPYKERIGEDDDIPNIGYIREYVRAEAGQAIIERFSRYYEDDNNFYDTRTGARAEDVISGDLGTGIFFTVAQGTPGANGTLGLNRQVFEVASVNRKGLFVGDATALGANKPHLKLYVNEPANPLDSKYSYIETDNGPLVLNPNNGLVKLKTKMEIEHLNVAETNPLPESNSNTIWSRGDQGAGGTGIYFANVTTQGEICSAAKALVYGLIF